MGAMPQHRRADDMRAHYVQIARKAESESADKVANSARISETIRGLGR
jgi:hypothetical protein